MSENIITTGTAVEWTSSSNGRTTTKRGIVAAIVPPDAEADVVVGKIPNSDGVEFMYGQGAPRSHESYIVRVSVGKRGRCVLYWPRVSALKVIGAQAPVPAQEKAAA